jgi:hypothetical protein
MSEYRWIMTRSHATDGERGLAATLAALPNHRRAIEDLAWSIRSKVR